MPKISVLTAAYNAEKTIVETYESIQNQTFSDFEWIVINDGSEDQTLELLKGIQDKRLKIFSYKNSGVCDARNRAISHATGEFIAFIDADDLWTPNKLASQLAALQKSPKAGIAYSWTHFKYENEEYSHSDTTSCFEGNVYANLLIGNFLHTTSNPLIRREAIDSIGYFDPALKASEEWDLYLRLAAKWEFAFVPEIQVIYRQSSNSLSYNVEVMEETAITVIEKAYKVAPEELYYLKKRSISEVFRYSAQQYLRFKNTNPQEIKNAVYKLLMAIQSKPEILLEEYTIFLIKIAIKKMILANLHSLNKISKKVYVL